MKVKKVTLVGIIACGLCFMFICFAVDYTQANGPGKITVFASDPDYGTVGMYREGDEHIFFEVKSTTTGGKVVTHAKFHDEKMNMIAASSSNSAPSYTPTASRTHQNLVSIAAGELQKHASLNHDVFIHEKAHLADFQDLYSNRSLNKRDMKASAAGVTPTRRALKTQDYFKGLQKNLKWQVNGSEIVGNYNGITFHTDYQVFDDKAGDRDHSGQPRIERYGRLTAANGKNIQVQLGGHWVPEGYTLGPGAYDTFDVDSNDPGERIESHHKSMGEAFMAGRVINSKSDFPGPEKEILAGLGTPLYNQILPINDFDDKGTPMAKTKTTGIKALFTAVSGSVKDLFTVKPAWAATNYKSTIKLYSKYIGGGIADHSGTWTQYYYWNGSYWENRGGTKYCNHGSCPGSSDMSYQCYTESYSGSFRIPPTYSSGGSYHSCLTAYCINTAIRCHVCNDDSWTQIRAVLGKSYGLYEGQKACGNFGIGVNSPGCNL